MLKKLLAALIGTAPMLSVREDRVSVREDRVLLAVTTPEYRRIMAQWSAIDRDRRSVR